MATVVPTVYHVVSKRGNRFVWYDDSEPNFGFSWRAAYAVGSAPPNYPVPSCNPTNDLICRALDVWQTATDWWRGDLSVDGLLVSMECNLWH